MITHAHHLLAKRFNHPAMPTKTLINDVMLEILDLLYTEEEAQVLSHLPLINATAKKVAKATNRPEHEIRPILDSLAKRGLIFAFKEGPGRIYFLVPLMPGLFEAQMWIAPDGEKTLRLAELYQEYLNEEFSRNMLKKPARVFKIVPIQESIPTAKSSVLPSDNIREVIDRHDAWSLANYCACRRQKEMIGEGCGKPHDVCMQFGDAARYIDKVGFGRLVSKEEILESVDRAEEAGLIHFTDNIELPYISCNCCACCCVSLATLTQFNTPAMFVNSRFVVAHDHGKCVACGKCGKACISGALHVYEKKLILEHWRCIGCGVCVTRCKEDALSLVPRADSRPVPENYAQLFFDIGNEQMGIQKYIDSLAPGYSRFLGNLIQKRFIKK